MIKSLHSLKITLILKFKRILTLDKNHSILSMERVSIIPQELVISLMNLKTTQVIGQTFLRALLSFKITLTHIDRFNRKAVILTINKIGININPLKRQA